MGIIKSLFFIFLTVSVITVAIRGERKLAKDRASVLAIRAWCFFMSVAAATTTILSVHDFVYAHFAAHPEAYETPETAGAAGTAMLIGGIGMVAVVLFDILSQDGLKCRSVAIWRAAMRERRKMEWRI